MNEERVRNWLKAQDMGYLLERLDAVALSDWEAVNLAEKLVDILLKLDSDRCFADFKKAEDERKGFVQDHSAQYESGL